MPENVGFCGLFRFPVSHPEMLTGEAVTFPGGMEVCLLFLL